MRVSVVIPCLVAAAFVVVAASECETAQAETIFGHVMGPLNPQTGERMPVPNEFLWLRRTDGINYQSTTVSAADGSYSFASLVAGGTYLISNPSSPNCPVAMFYIPPNSPPGFQGTPLPSGLTLPPGPPSNVDLDIPGCRIDSPCVDHTVAPDVVVAALFAFSSPTSDPETVSLATPAPRFDRSPELYEICWDPPWAWPAPLGIDVRMEWLESSVARSPVTIRDAHARFEATPLLPGDRVRLSIDPLQAALSGVEPVGSTAQEFVYDPANGHPVPAVEFRVRRVFTVSGRAFVEHGTENGVFDGADTPLPGLSVLLYDDFRSPAPAPPVDATMTDADGRYRFSSKREAFYRVVLVTPGAAEDPSSVRLVEGADERDVDFPFTETTCPHLPCAVGDVHEVALDARVFVGAVDPAAPLTVDVDLLDGCERRSRLEHASGWCRRGKRDRLTGVLGVATVESTTVDGGFATVRVRLTAGGVAFPAGFFGPVDRGLVVSVNGIECSTCLHFACEALQPGTVLAAAPPPAPRGGGGCGHSVPPACDFTVVDLWGDRPWRQCMPAVSCPDSSTTLDGGVNALDLEVLVRAPKKSAKARHSVSVDFDDGAYSDDGRATFTESLTVPTTGRRGLLTIVSTTRVDDVTWRVRLRLRAPDRPDANPGAFPFSGARLEVRVDDVEVRSRLDFRTLPIGAGVVNFLNAIDAGCGYRGR